MSMHGLIRFLPPQPKYAPANCIIAGRIFMGYFRSLSLAQHIAHCVESRFLARKELGGFHSAFSEDCS